MKLKTVITAYDVEDSASLTPASVPMDMTISTDNVMADPVKRQDDLGVDVDFDSSVAKLDGNGTSVEIKKDVTIGASAINMLPVSQYSEVSVLVEFAGGVSSGGGIPEAPTDGNIYGRKDGAWEKVDVDIDLSPYAKKIEETTTGSTTQGKLFLSDNVLHAYLIDRATTAPIHLAVGDKIEMSYQGSQSASVYIASSYTDGEAVTFISNIFKGLSFNYTAEIDCVIFIAAEKMFSPLPSASYTLTHYKDLSDVEAEVETKLSDAPQDSKIYGRKDGEWTEVEAKIDIDSELSDTSENPVQNKAVKKAVDNVADTLNTLVEHGIGKSSYGVALYEEADFDELTADNTLAGILYFGLEPIEEEEGTATYDETTGQLSVTDAAYDGETGMLTLPSASFDTESGQVQFAQSEKEESTSTYDEEAGTLAVSDASFDSETGEVTLPSASFDETNGNINLNS